MFRSVWLAAVCVAGSLAAALLLNPVLPPSTLFLGSVVLAGWFGGIGSGLLAAISSTLLIDFLFIEPYYQFTLSPARAPGLAVFALCAVFINWASAKRRQAERSLKEARDATEAQVRERTAQLTEANEALQRQANMLEQTHDAILVWEFPRTITYWNRGAEQLYGFTKEEAIGRRAHELLQTEHPVPVSEFESVLERDGEWTGELVHATRDGRRITVDSRHVLMRTAEGKRLVLETNRDITERKRSERALEELAGRLIHAQEEERSRIGRELHDHVSQRLGVLAIKIDQLRIDAATSSPAVSDALDQLRQDTSDVTHDIHRLSHRLHSSMLDHLGLVPAVHRLIGEFSQRHRITIAFTHAAPARALQSDVALCLFRIVEESLTNIVKHSGAQSARVDIAFNGDDVHLVVEDAGRGFDPKILDRRAGLGFVSMRERLRLVRGTIQIESTPQRGTKLNIWVPAAEARDGTTGQPHVAAN